MSINYTLYTDDDPYKAMITTVSISDAHHRGWQQSAGIWRPAIHVGGERRLVQTYSTDAKPVGIGLHFFEKLFRLNTTEEEYPELHRIYTVAQFVGCDLIFV